MYVVSHLTRIFVFTSKISDFCEVITYMNNPKNYYIYNYTVYAPMANISHY